MKFQLSDEGGFENLMKTWRRGLELFQVNELAVFIPRTHYPSERTWTNICSSSGYASLV